MLVEEVHRPLAGLEGVALMEVLAAIPCKSVVPAGV
jgi:hypothetical protein